MDCHFAAVISKRGLITFQHSSLEQPIAFQLFVTGWPIAFQHSSLSLCHLFFTDLLYYRPSCWFRVNTSESAGMNLWITEIKWSAGMNHLIWFSYNEPVELKPSGSHSHSLTPKEEKRKRGKTETEWENVGNEEKIENAVHLLKRLVTCLNKEIKDNEKLVVEMITSH